MLHPILDRALTTILALIIGMVFGAIAAAVLGVIFSALLFVSSLDWRRLTVDSLGSMILPGLIFGGTLGSPFGLIVGVGCALAGVRTKLAVEWPLIAGVGAFLGCCVAFGTQFGTQIDIIAAGVSAIPAAIIALIGWLAALAIKGLIGERLVLGPLKPWVVAAHLATAILVALICFGIVRFVATGPWPS